MSENEHNKQKKNRNISVLKIFNWLILFLKIKRKEKIKGGEGLKNSTFLECFNSARKIYEHIQQENWRRSQLTQTFLIQSYGTTSKRKKLF